MTHIRNTIEVEINNRLSSETEGESIQIISQIYFHKMQIITSRGKITQRL